MGDCELPLKHCPSPREKYSLGPAAKNAYPAPSSHQDNVLADLPLGLAKLKHVLELLDLSHNRLQQVRMGDKYGQSVGVDLQGEGCWI